ncbi:hypothetical protein BH10CYA1_BH10CYA1_01210 [soil metagenome]
MLFKSMSELLEKLALTSIRCKNIAKTVSALAFSTLIAQSLCFQATCEAATGQRLADDTLLVMLAPHADRVAIRAAITSATGCQLIQDMHVNSADYSIFHLRPPNGKSETALQQIMAMVIQDNNLVSVHRNYLGKALFQRAVPNDPAFSQQWPLSDMRWIPARNLYSTKQVHPAYITILGSGTQPVRRNNELGAYITQYNAMGTTVTREPVHGSNPEGDIDSSITGCLTDNSEMMAGAGCFIPSVPCYLTNVQITDNGDVSYSVIENALVWCINNQSLRGGPGPCNLSYGVEFGDPPIWSVTDIQTLAGTLLGQGDILVMAAGDDKGTYTTYPTGNVVVVQGTDKARTLASYLTHVQGDPAAAPGGVQPSVVRRHLKFLYYGSSFSAPFWCAGIAMLISINPSLTSAQASQILINTGSPVRDSSWSAVIPAFDRAIAAALN